MQPGSQGEVILAQQVRIVGPNDGVFVYDGSGNLVDSIAAQVGTAPLPGIVSYSVAQSLYSRLTGGQIELGSRAAGSLLTVPAEITVVDALAAGTAPAIIIDSPAADAGVSVAAVNISGGSRDGTQVPTINLDSTIAAGIVAKIHGTLSVTGSAANQEVFIENQGTTGHALTVKLSGIGGTSQAAINIVSLNNAFSAAEITGTETNRGTLKITHQGYAAGTDANAAALSIDVQTTEGGVTGTQARGIFITSTTDTNPAGDAIIVRYNGLDAFVIKGSGRVGIGGAVGHIPSGQLEIVQTDTTTAGLSMTAIAAGTDMIRLKESGGGSRFRVDNAGNLILGSDVTLGGGVAVQKITNAVTAPTAAPTAGGVLYAQAGALKWIGSSGNITTIAPA